MSFGSQQLLNDNLGLQLIPIIPQGWDVAYHFECHAIIFHFLLEWFQHANLR